MLLQPKPLPQHFLQRIADRIVVAADDRLDFRARRAQALFEGIGGIQNRAQSALALAAAFAQEPGGGGRSGCDTEQDQGQSHTVGLEGRTGSLPRAPAVGKFLVWTRGSEPLKV